MLAAPHTCFAPSQCRRSGTIVSVLILVLLQVGYSSCDRADWIFISSNMSLTRPRNLLSSLLQCLSGAVGRIRALDAPARCRRRLHTGHYGHDIPQP
ncbi:hypothetical protein C8Q72DRAFT_109359 [Fomitopsis betulina]|nr:hypothetical protein C8Q72DRAFT_109359 [Fomitopsis betulina]